MAKIFISYSHGDADTEARYLYEKLSGAGYEVWMDNESLLLGTEFAREIEAAIDQQHVFIGLISPMAVESDWIQREWGAAMKGGITTIPVLLDNIEIPEWVTKRQCLRMSRGGDDWEALHKLVNHLPGGKEIPRLFNASGRNPKPDGVLILGTAPFIHLDLGDPTTFIEVAEQTGRAAYPFIDRAGAGLIPPGHSALATALLAYLLGVKNRMPRIFISFRGPDDEYYVAKDVYVSLLSMQELGSRSRKEIT